MDGEIQSVIFPVCLFQMFLHQTIQQLERISWLSVGGVLCSAMLAIRAAYFPHSIHTNVRPNIAKDAASKYLGLGGGVYCMLSF